MRTMLTLECIQKWIDHIKESYDDDEHAHGEEDALHQEVLLAISEERCEKPVEAAKLALTTLNIKFHRWCA